MFAAWLRPVAARLRLELMVRRRDPLTYARRRYANALRIAADVARAHEFPGGQLKEDGDFYLDVRGLWVYYNIRHKHLTFGDGQSLDIPSGRITTPLERFVLDSVPERGVYIDVGANNGFFYALQVGLQHPDARVFAFEPDPEILPHLERNVAVNGLAEQITVVPVALSDTVTDGRLTAGLGASGYLLDSNDVHGVQVRVTTLDTFVADNRIDRIDVIKVDVEGHEERVLAGARETLAAFHPTLVLELTDRLLARFGGSRGRVERTLSELGYSLRQVEGSNDVIAQATHAGSSIT
jgi:FkbM family methyltransferase